MLRITELRLPIGHPPEALRDSLCERLRVSPADIVSFAIARRANDARKKSAIVMVYSVDATFVDEGSVLERNAGDHRVRRAPDTAYRFFAGLPGDADSLPVEGSRATCREIRRFRPSWKARRRCRRPRTTVVATLDHRPRTAPSSSVRVRADSSPR